MWHEEEPYATYRLHSEDAEQRGWSNRHGLLLGLGFAAFCGGAATYSLIAPTSFHGPSALKLANDILADCDHATQIKRTVCEMDHALVSLGETWKDFETFSTQMQAFWDESFAYLPMYGIEDSVGMRDWYYKEMWSWTEAFPWVEFNQMLFLGSGCNASSATVAVGDWKAPLGPLAPTGGRMSVRITDFYVAGEDGRIAQNFMMIDLLDLLRQQGVLPLRLSPLPQGRVSAPHGDGMPAPLARYVSLADAEDARRIVAAMLDAEWVGTSKALKLWDRDELIWYGPVPFGMASGGAQFVEHFLEPFHSAFGEERRLRYDAFACEGQYCAVRGTFSGRHTGNWLGFPPSGRVLELDVGMHWRVREGKIVEAWAIFDLPRMLLPLGVDLLRDPPKASPGVGAAKRGGSEGKGASQVSKAALLNNDCSNAYTQPPGGSESAFDCPAFVIRSTDETWHPRSWEATNKAVDTYFSEDWQSVRAFGMMLRGREELRAFMKDWLGGFPDVFIHVADVFCLGNEGAGYKTTMPYVLTATHSGWSKAFGKPSGRRVKYHGIANCYIKREPLSGQWQYTREWDLPDMWAFITALNLTADTMPHHPSGDLVPVDQCKPLFEWGSGEMNWFPPNFS